jgi:AAHS family benzoate transporter-like MFS transporter
MTTEPTTTDRPARRATAARWVRPLCWTAVALEGFDLVVIGVVMPVLLRDPSWDLDPAGASVVVTVGLLGVMVGALAVGPIADVIGAAR